MINHGSYDPDKALRVAISDWMVEIMDSKTANGKFRRRRTTVPESVLGPNPPALPGVNTCMSTTTTTPTQSEADALRPHLPLAEEIIRKNKEAFDNLAAMVGANVADPETFRPQIATNAINSLVAKPDDMLEPMECNGDGLLEKAPLSVIPTKTPSSLGVQTCTSADSKVSDMSMQIDADSPSPKRQPAVVDSGSDSTQDTEMQIDSADVDKLAPSGNEEEEIVTTAELDMPKESAEPAVKLKDEGVMEAEEVEPDKQIERTRMRDKITEEDMLLLVELFYLPYEHGARAVAMLEEVHWLKAYAHNVCEAKSSGKVSDQVSLDETIAIFVIVGCVSSTVVNRWCICCLYIFHKMLKFFLLYLK